MQFDLRNYHYKLPAELIAQSPLHRRDQARLMVVDREKQTIGHDVFKNITRYLPKGAGLVLNDSKVVPVRLLGKRATGAEVEIFLLKKTGENCYEALLRPLKRLKVGEKIIFGNNELTAEILDKERRLVRFNKKNIYPALERVGKIPLPPYIKRKARAEDKKYYQTVYAKKKGSVAAPTAGLHFTEALLKKIQKLGHPVDRVTLHVNYATFKPVEEKDIRTHKMHFEDYEVARAVYRRLQKAKEEKRKVIAVGTTSTRVLESCFSSGNLSGATDLFIYPGYSFQCVDGLITNFHLPHSSLLMLVFAFGGEKLMKRAYREAIKEKYRFFSYGDAMVIL